MALHAPLTATVWRFCLPLLLAYVLCHVAGQLKTLNELRPVLDDVMDGVMM